VAQLLVVPQEETKQKEALEEAELMDLLLRH
jgi:hypothetical protein